MRSAYLDTSVVLPFYVPETHSVRAEAILRSASERVISDLTGVEICAGLMRKVREGALAQAAAGQVWAAFQRHQAEGFYRLVSIADRHWVMASQCVLQTGAVVPLRSLDGLHLAIALLEGLPLVSGDSRLLQAGRALGVSVRALAS